MYRIYSKIPRFSGVCVKAEHNIPSISIVIFLMVGFMGDKRLWLGQVERGISPRLAYGFESVAFRSMRHWQRSQTRNNALLPAPGIFRSFIRCLHCGHRFARKKAQKPMDKPTIPTTDPTIRCRTLTPLPKTRTAAQTSKKIVTAFAKSRRINVRRLFELSGTSG